MKTKSQLERDRNNQLAKAEQWQKGVRAKLYKMLGAGGSSLAKFTGSNLSKGSADYREYLKGLGGINVPYGTAPNDIQVADYIKSIGGNPHTKKATRIGEQIVNQKALGTGATQGSSASRSVNAAINKDVKKQSLLQKFFEDAQGKQDEANAANESRYADILGRLEGSRDRNLERVSNFGVAAREDLDERSAETLGNMQANLSARGLGNSTIFDAFRQRNERDLGREQQRLSEQVDTRSAQYDQKLTGDIASFMERRTDQAPDFAQLQQLAQQYGLSNDGQGFDGGQSEGVAAPVEGTTFTGGALDEVAQSAASQGGQQQYVPYGVAPKFGNANGFQQSQNLFGNLNQRRDDFNQGQLEFRQRNAPRRRSPEHYKKLGATMAAQKSKREQAIAKRRADRDPFGLFN